MPYNYSIIIPYRDKYELLVKAVGSIPDREDIQVIIIDNSSKPLPQEKVPAMNNANVLFAISSPTKGAGCARNEGLKLAEGRFLLFLDADDYFTQDAFSAIDKFLDKDYDIVFFKSTSVRLCDGEPSNRHKAYETFINDFLSDGNEDKLRFWITVPWGKLIRAELVKTHSIVFDETLASNDLMFSVKTGYFATKIGVSTDVIYVVTEASANQSIDKTKTKEAQFARFVVGVSQYEFMEKVGRKDQRFSLLSYVLHSWWDFGFSEFIKYLRYARMHNVNIFANKFKFKS